MTKDKKVVTYPDSIETRVALLEMSISNINDTMKEIKSEMKDIRSDLHTGFTDIRKEMKSDFRWMLTILIGLVASLGGIMAHGFHWF